jgi:predicted permease
VGHFETDFAGISPGYLETMQIPLQRGRTFTVDDREGGQAVAIINETLAHRVWPGEDPVGKMIQFGSSASGTARLIVGVAGDSKYRSIGEQGVGMLYTPISQSQSRDLAMVVRAGPGAGDIGPSLRNLMLELDPNLPLATNAPFRDLISMSLLPNRIAGLVAAIFGGTGLLLATVGLFGVLAFTVQRRRREIGVRMALGAGAERIRRMVVRDGLRLTSIGLVVGLILAAVVAQLLRGLLFGLSPLDPVTYGAIAVLMFGTALVACMEPVRRALRTEPLEVLRHD